MKEQYRLTFALCLTALFVTGVVLGAITLANYNTDVTNATAKEAVIPVDTTLPEDTAVSSPENTINESANTLTTPNTIPGFGIVAAIMFILFAIYLSHKGK